MKDNIKTRLKIRLGKVKFVWGMLNIGFFFVSGNQQFHIFAIYSNLDITACYHTVLIFLQLTQQTRDLRSLDSKGWHNCKELANYTEKTDSW